MSKPIHVVLYSALYSTLNVVFFLLTCLVYVVQSIVKFLIPSRYRYCKSLEGEVVLVTGAGGGLGRLLVTRLAKLKATVVLWDIDIKG